MDIGDILAILPQQIVFGLALGAVYALLAVGYTMVYGVLFMINFAHGDVLMIGSMAGWAILTGAIVAIPGAPLIVLLLAVIVAALLAGALGVAIERIAYRPLYARGSSRLGPLISALGVSMILQNTTLMVMGANALVYPTRATIAGLSSIRLGMVTISPIVVIMGVVTLISMLFVEWLVVRTKWGRGMRALRENRQATMLMGVNIDRTVALTFFVGSVAGGHRRCPRRPVLHPDGFPARLVSRAQGFRRRRAGRHRHATPDRIHFGNMAEKGVDAIWNGPEMRAFRDELSSETPPEVCRSCAIYSGTF